MAKNKKKSEGTKPVGRPKKVLSEELKKSIILLLSLGCSVDEVAANTGVSRTRLYANFGTVIKTGMDSFKCNLKKHQAKRAFAGSDTMLIWLGKQYLGQKDKQEINTGEVFKVDVNIEKELEKRGIPMPKVANEDVDD